LILVEGGDGFDHHRPLSFERPSDRLANLHEQIHKILMAQRKKRRSSIHQFVYDIRYRFGEYALRAFIGALPYVPFRVSSLFVSFMARVTFTLLWKYRARMEENVSLTLAVEIPKIDERKSLVWRSWRNFAQSVLDTMAVMHYSRQRIVSTVALEGEGYLKDALAKGKGVLALSAHLGSFTMIGPRLAAGGYPFSVVVKQPADERFARLIDDYRARLGIHTISAKPRREAVRGILRALRDNHVVLVIADEFKSGDVSVDFLGLKAPAPRGPATLALRTGAVTLPMFATRRAPDSLVLAIGAPIEPVEREDLEESVVATTAVYARCLEAAIRKYPDQWNWLGLPRRDGKMSRADMARIWRESKGARADPTKPKPKTAGSSSQ
jgi:KDO2-lipid IV(A) lauroyltransferase